MSQFQRQIELVAQAAEYGQLLVALFLTGMVDDHGRLPLGVWRKIVPVPAVGAAAVSSLKSAIREIKFQLFLFTDELIETLPLPAALCWDTWALDQAIRHFENASDDPMLTFEEFLKI